MNLKINKECKEKQERSTDEIARSILMKSLLIDSTPDNNTHDFLFNKPYKLERYSKMSYAAGMAIYDILHMVEKQKEQWGDEKHLSPHQWLGLIAEEIGEMTEAVNETYLPNRTKEHLGSIEHIQEEAIQAMALMVRFLESINEEQTND